MVLWDYTDAAILKVLIYGYVVIICYVLVSL